MTWARFGCLIIIMLPFCCCSACDTLLIFNDFCLFNLVGEQGRNYYFFVVVAGEPEAELRKKTKYFFCQLSGKLKNVS